MRLFLVGCFVLGFALHGAASARASINGRQGPGCNCHFAMVEPKLTIVSDPKFVAPGGLATLTIQVEALKGPIAGLFVSEPTKKGTLQVIGGESTKIAGDQGISHSAPKRAVGGSTTFRVQWKAPAEGQGTANFDITGVSANGDRNRMGDAYADARFSLTWGCEGIDAFIDSDGDGFGDGKQPARLCAFEPGHAMKAGDCADYAKTSYPGAPELCNAVDDDCDGMIDEELPIVLVYPDYDQDGHGDPKGLAKMGCVSKSASALADDCDDADPTTYKGAVDLCSDGKDNDCNGRVDDKRPPACLPRPDGGAGGIDGGTPPTFPGPTTPSAGSGSLPRSDAGATPSAGGAGTGAVAGADAGLADPLDEEGGEPGATAGRRPATPAGGCALAPNDASSGIALLGGAGLLVALLRRRRADRR